MDNNFNENIIGEEKKKNKLIKIIILIVLCAIVALLLILFLSNKKENKKIENSKYEMSVGESISALSDIQLDKYTIDISDKNIAIIDEETGTIEALNTGEVTITIRSKEDSSIKEQIIINVKKESKLFSFKEKSYSCEVGEIIDTEVNYDKQNGLTLSTVKSSDISIATISKGHSKGLASNCSDCEAVHITCNNEGSVTLKAALSDGSEASTSIKVSTGEITFKQESYTCKAGETINTTVNFKKSAGITLFSVSSSNTNVATIKVGRSDGAVTNCSDCEAVHITCNKKGSITVKATTSAGTQGSATVAVSDNDTGSTSVAFKQTSYTCEAGETINTVVNFNKQNGVSLSSVESSDPGIANVGKGRTDGLVPNCTSCEAVHITCNKKGTVTVKATLSNGVKASTSVTVSNSEIQDTSVAFKQASYTCEAGKTINTIVNFKKSGGVTLTSLSSSNSNVATISKGRSDGAVTNCSDCEAVHITCNKKGTVTVKAVTSAGSQASASVTVNSGSENVKVEFKQTSYTCEAGEVINTVVNYAKQDGIKLYSLGSSDDSIATIDSGRSDGAVTNCSDCEAVHITCNKKGTVTLTVTLSNGSKGNTSVTVSESEPETTVSFKQDSYTCEVGKTINTIVNFKKSGGVTLANLASSNDSIATIGFGRTDGLVPNCSDCEAVHITCNKKGTASLTATLSNGSKGNASVSVTQ